jgi:hypothetical protein
MEMVPKETPFDVSQETLLSLVKSCWEPSVSFFWGKEGSYDLPVESGWCSYRAPLDPT